VTPFKGEYCEECAEEIQKIEEDLQSLEEDYDDREAYE
jgi:hypothetical protein